MCVGRSDFAGLGLPFLFDYNIAPPLDADEKNAHKTRAGCF